MLKITVILYNRTDRMETGFSLNSSPKGPGNKLLAFVNKLSLEKQANSNILTCSLLAFTSIQFSKNKINKFSSIL